MSVCVQVALKGLGRKTGTMSQSSIQMLAALCSEALKLRENFYIAQFALKTKLFCFLETMFPFNDFTLFSLKLCAQISSLEPLFFLEAMDQFHSILPPKPSVLFGSPGKGGSSVPAPGVGGVADRQHHVSVESETTGHGVEEQRFCEHYAPMRGFVRGRFGPSTISMKISCCYTEVDLDKWTKAAKCKILEACRSELAESEGPVLNTLFEQPNLVLSWLDSNHLRKVHELVPKVNIIFLFRPRDDFSYEWEKWARGHNVFLVLHDLEPDDPHWNSKPLDEMGVMRHSFAAACTDTINTLNTFLKYEGSCPVCKEKRTIHAVFACDGTSKSVGALLASIMFFGHCDANTALSHLLKKPRVWKPLPLVDHTYILEALFHQEQCIRAAIGR